MTPMPNLTNRVAEDFIADARFLATCVTGYWPGIEDAIDWSNPDASPILAAAKRVQAWKPAVTPVIVEPEKARGCTTAVRGEPHAP